jgi:hypothetical protein
MTTKTSAFRFIVATIISLLLTACVPPNSSVAANTPQAACERLGIGYSSPSWDDCLIRMGAADRDAANAQKMLNCQNAKNAAAQNNMGGFATGFINAQNVHMACD